MSCSLNVRCLLSAQILQNNSCTVLQFFILINTLSGTRSWRMVIGTPPSLSFFTGFIWWDKVWYVVAAPGPYLFFFSCCTRPLVCPRCNGWAPPLFCPSRNTRPRTCYNSYTIPQVIQNRLIFIKNLGQTSRIQIHEIKTNFGKLRPFRSVPSPIIL